MLLGASGNRWTLEFLMHKILDGLLPLAIDINVPALLEKNPNRGNVEAMKAALLEFGQRKPITIHVDGNVVQTGNHTLMAARELGWDKIAAVYVEDDPTKAKAWIIADNHLGRIGEEDQDILAEYLADIMEENEDLLAATAYTEDDLLAMLADAGPPESLSDEEQEKKLEQPPEDWAENAKLSAQPAAPKAKLNLFDRFLVPPFSVLNARDGWWVERKRSWLELGIEGELGREDKPRTWYLAAPGHHSGGVVPEGTAERKKQGEIEDDGLLYGDGATSVFDPVLCELVYRWFCPPGGKVLDPFAGGSVRGIVASKLGRSYTGIELREVQVVANEAQRAEILGEDGELPKPVAIVPDVPTDSQVEYTPIQMLGPDYAEAAPRVWLKREDLYSFAGVRGAKVRACVAFIERAKAQGVGVVTAGARQSPQVNFVAQIAHRLGVSCRVHVPSGALTPEILAARAAGAKVIQHDFGYNTVIVKAAREDAANLGWVEIPYGMESQESIDFTAPQVANLPADCHRIVNATGSGMTLAGILHGLKLAGRDDVKVLAVCVGHVPEERLDKWAPKGWRDMVEIVDDPSPYEQPAPDVFLGDVQLDAYYEAKCLPYLEEGDCFWISAIRPSAVPAVAPLPEWICGDSRQLYMNLSNEYEADMIFTCPPYGDLEVYSDDPRDLSTMDYREFIEALGLVMERSYDKLKDDSFAVIVVGDYRDKDGYYRNFPGDTIKLMEAAGFKYLNEAILVTQLASLPIRVGRQFDATRKMGKTHQQCLVFVKGDAAAATRRCGPVVSVDMEEES